MPRKCLFFFTIFVLNDISECLVSNCSFNIYMEQFLFNEGFHRNISYHIVFNDDVEDSGWLYMNCIIGLEQALPPGVFVNPDELKDLRRLDKINAFPRNKVNVELPAEQSFMSYVYIIGKVTSSRVNLWLPVHARYHSAKAGGGTAKNVILSPTLYLRCPDERLDACHATISKGATFLCNGGSQERCDWKKIPYTLISDTLLWLVPVGNTDLYYMVSMGTGLVIIVGSLYLLKIIHDFKVEKWFKS